MRHILGIGLVLMLAVFLRLRLLQNDLWIDEVWSMKLATLMQSPQDVFFLHSDNNHYLNTLWLYALGPLQPFWLYRIPALLSSLCLIFAVMQYGRKNSQLAGWIAGLLIAVSPALTVFSTQARGYMPMLLFGFLSFVQMEKVLQKPTVSRALLFVLLAATAFLWQLTYIHLYAALFIWSLIVLLRHEHGRWLLILMHGLVAALLALLAVTDLTQFALGGGPASGPLQFALGSVSLLFTTPATGIIPITLGVTTAIFLIWKTETLFHTDAPKAWALATLLLGSPVLWMLFFHPPFIYPRHMLICLFFVLLIVALQMTDMIRHKKTVVSATGLLFLSMYLASSTLGHINLKQGTQEYSVVLSELLKQAPAGPVMIGSSQDFRTGLLLWFYGMRLAPERNILYVDKNMQKDITPEYWLLDAEVENPAQPVTVNGTSYEPIPETAANATKWLLLQAVQ